MKTMLATLVALAIAATLWAESASSSGVPAAVADVGTAKPETYMVKVAELPPSVISALKQATKMDELKMADKGGTWNKTDVVEDSTLPFRRLIWAVEVKRKFVVHYECGGRGYNTQFLVLSPEDTKGQRTLLWAAVAFSPADDYSAFLQLVEKNKVMSDPRFTHR